VDLFHVCIWEIPGFGSGDLDRNVGTAAIGTVFGLPIVIGIGTSNVRHRSGDFWRAVHLNE